jgi:predicted nucleic acid-binding protein
MILVDTNVLIDVLADDPAWSAWSAAQLDRWAIRDQLAVNPIVYAELAPRFSSPQDLDRVLHEMRLRFVEPDRRALFLAGRAFHAYRRRGGRRQGVLPDFSVGAQAAVLGAPILTRDVGRYRRYFPGVLLISPSDR